MDDAQWARLARALADALMTFARDRGDAAKKHVAELQTELCRERRAELDQPPPSPPEPQPTDPPPKPPATLPSATVPAQEAVL